MFKGCGIFDAFTTGPENTDRHTDLLTDYVQGSRFLSTRFT